MKSWQDALELIATTELALARELRDRLADGTVVRDSTGQSTAGELLAIYRVRAAHVHRLGIPHRGIDRVLSELSELSSSEIVWMFSFIGQADYFLVFLREHQSALLGVLWIEPRAGSQP